MATTMSAAELIDLSVRENRTVTEYPETCDQYEALLHDLLDSSDGDTGTTRCSGDGYSGPEGRGWTEVRSSDGWRVDLIHPPE